MKKIVLLCVCILVLGGYWIYTMLSAPMVSVVLPVYNGNKHGWLDRSISSILNQSYTDLELILIDDGSTDDSWEVLKKYASKDKRVRLYKNKENMGISKTRNRGNDLARGKYIIPMDQDDDNDLDRIKVQVSYMEQNPWLTVSIMGATMPRSDPLTAVHEEDLIKMSLFINNFVGHPNTMTRHSFLKKHHIRYNPDIKCANDYDLFLQILRHGGRFSRMYINLFKYNGPNYSGAGGPCFQEAVKIREKWLHFDERHLSRKEMLCVIAKRLKTLEEYKNVFSYGFLEKLISDNCPKEDVHELKHKEDNSIIKEKWLNHHRKI